MADILPRHYIIGIILFTFFIVGGMAMMNEFNKSDDTFTDDEKFTQFNKSFDKMAELTTSVETLKGKIDPLTGEEEEIKYGVFGVLNALIETSWNALRTIFSAFGFMDDIFNAISIVFGVPVWVGSLLILLVTVLLVFSIWSAIFQTKL